MKIVENFQHPDKEKTKKLKEVSAGDVIRMAEVPFSVAQKEGLFYLVCWRPDTLIPDNAKTAFDSRTALVRLGGKFEVEWRDSDREVVVHDSQLVVLPIIETVRRASVTEG